MLIGRERSEPGRWNRFIACEAIIEHTFGIGQEGGITHRGLFQVIAIGDIVFRDEQDLPD